MDLIVTADLYSALRKRYRHVISFRCTFSTLWRSNESVYWSASL